MTTLTIYNGDIKWILRMRKYQAQYYLISLYENIIDKFDDNESFIRLLGYLFEDYHSNTLFLCGTCFNLKVYKSSVFFF